MSEERLRERIAAASRRRSGSPKLLFAFYGALGGVALAVLAIIVSIVQAHETFPGAQAASLLAAGALFGVIVGLDFHSTRTWRRFGRYTLPARFILACSAGGTAMGLVGMLLGVMTRADLWKYTGGGAMLGLVLLVWVKLAGEH